MSLCSGRITISAVADARTHYPCLALSDRGHNPREATVDVTCAEAVSSAVNDLALMERLTALANAWTDLAALLAERDRV